jgi:hypothetical protein
MAVTKRLRYEILRRDNHACRYCGAPAAPDTPLTVDHVVPVALGGSDDPSNLVAACRDCNSGKSATPADAALVADVAADALRWSKAMDVANRMAVEDYKQIELWHEMFRNIWDRFTVTVPTHKRGSGQPEPIPLPHDWRTTIAELAASGMNALEMRDAIGIAMSRNPDDRFLYFAGVVRNKIRNKQDVARELLNRGDV